MNKRLRFQETGERKTRKHEERSLCIFTIKFTTYGCCCFSAFAHFIFTNCSSIFNSPSSSVSHGLRSSLMPLFRQRGSRAGLDPRGPEVNKKPLLSSEGPSPVKEEDVCTSYYFSALILKACRGAGAQSQCPASELLTRIVST